MRAYLGIVLLTFFIAGCAPQPIVPRENLPEGEDTVTIAQGTQYNRGDLRIGVVNVKEDAATLAIIVEAAEPSEAQAPNFVTVTLAVDEETTADGYTIRNLQTKTGIGGFMPGQSSGSVTLHITASEAPHG